MPRHPPCALKNLATDARVHCAVLKQRPATHHPQTSTSSRGRLGRRHRTLRHPTACPARPASMCVPRRRAVLTPQPAVPNNQRSTHEQPVQTFACVWPWTACGLEVLLRKEVIQPHLPVRLPCDFVPIASPTFDSSLPKGLGHRLRVLPTFVT